MTHSLSKNLCCLLLQLGDGILLSCEDMNPQCSTYASLGYCSTYEFMTTDCKTSCNLCDYEDYDFLSIHNGGSDNSEMVAKLTGQRNNTTISVSGNQMFVVFKTNHENVNKGFHALILESKYFDENK